MVPRSHLRASLLVVLMGAALLLSSGSLAQAQTASDAADPDRAVAAALTAMALWEGAPGGNADASDDGVYFWTGQPDGAYGLFRLGHVLHVPGSPDVEHSQAYRSLVGQYRRAFPDLRVAVDEVVPYGNTVMVRWTMAGTHTGDFGGLAPTGAPFQIGGITIFRIAHGEIAETWFMPDARGLLTQLAPAPVA